MSTPFGVLATSSLPLIVSFANLNGTLANGTSTVNGTVGIGDLGSDGGGGMLRYVWAVCECLGLQFLLVLKTTRSSSRTPAGKLQTAFCSEVLCFSVDSDCASSPVVLVAPCPSASLVRAPSLLTRRAVRALTESHTSVTVWAALVNSTPSSGFSSTPLDSDLAIALPTLILSLSALSLGWLRAFTYIGHLLLTTAAGVALVLQVVLFKEALVVPSLQGVLALMGAGGLGGLFVGIWKQRVGVVSLRFYDKRRRRLTGTASGRS